MHLPKNILTKSVKIVSFLPDEKVEAVQHFLLESRRVCKKGVRTGRSSAKIYVKNR